MRNKLPKLPQPNGRKWTEAQRNKALNLIPKLQGSIESPVGLRVQLEHAHELAMFWAEEIANDVGGGRLPASAAACIRAAATTYAWSNEFARQASRLMAKRELNRQDIDNQIQRLAEGQARLVDSVRMSLAAAYNFAERHACITVDALQPGDDVLAPFMEELRLKADEIDLPEEVS